MDKNLVSMNKLKSDIKSMESLSIFFNSNQKKKIKEVEKQLDEMLTQIDKFNSRFSDSGWCAYDSMSMYLIKKCNVEFEKNGLESAERILIDYYKSDVKEITHWIKNSSKEFSDRYNLLQAFFKNHFDEMYYSSVPLGLIIIDGAVNDFTKSKGFFAEGTNVDAWDCLVGCSEGLEKLKKTFNKNRKKTNFEIIKMPYRNGILHGRDLNYANEYVSCKVLSLMFVVADWMKMKNSEEQRKEEYHKSINPPPIWELIKHMKYNKEVQDEIEAWEKRIVCVGKDIPIYGNVEEYIEYPYIVVIINMINAWRDGNYGELSKYLKRMFSVSLSEGRRAGECRDFFENKKLISFELVEVEERACALSKVVIKVRWKENEKVKESELVFGCVYQGDEEKSEVAVPWRDNGEWVIMPWNIQGLYSL